MKSETHDEGQPCDHPLCLYHVSHPCEGCGRIGGRSVKYIAWATQKGEGCGYMIGCGQVLWELKARTDHEVEEEIRERIAQSTYRDWALRYKSITVYRVVGEREIRVATMYGIEKARLAKEAAQTAEEEEKALYERLKGKYT